MNEMQAHGLLIPVGSISAIRVQSTASIQSVINQSSMNRFKETRR